MIELIPSCRSGRRTGITLGDAAILALPVIAAVAAGVSRLRVPAIAGAIAGVLLVAYTGRTTWVGPAVMSVLLILLIVALAAGGRPAPTRVAVGRASARCLPSPWRRRSRRFAPRRRPSSGSTWR